jgi:hypothetical protein
MLLEVILDVFPINNSLRSEITPSEEQGKNDLTGITMVIGGPYHLGELGRILVEIVDYSSFCVDKTVRIETACIQGPHWRARPAAKSRPLEARIRLCLCRAIKKITDHVLMRIEYHIEPILLSQPQNRNCMLNPGFVIFARTSMLYRLPCEDVSERVEAISTNSSKMPMSLIDRKRSADKRHVVSIEEAFSDVRADVGLSRHLRVRSHVEAAKPDLTIRRIAKRAPFNPER